MNKNILILGKGFIGTALKKELNCAVTNKMIRSFADADRLLKKYRPKIIINCAGVTGKNNVDDCELDKENTLFANSFLPVILAEAALRNGVRLVHISTGCMFEYDYKHSRPVRETDAPDFFGLFYSRSKIYSELALAALSDKFNILIVRIRVPLLDKAHPKNLLTKLIKYGKVIELPNSVTYIPDFTRALKHLLRVKARGIYNVMNKGGLRYSRLMDVYAKYAPGFRYKKIKFNKLNLTRTNLIMSTVELEKSGFKVRPINSVLEECVKNYLKS